MKKTEKAPIDNLCKNCLHWKNEQRDLNYYGEIGFCLNSKFKFETRLGRLVGIWDTENIKAVEGNPTFDFESKDMRITKSRYLLQTREDFGCNQFK